MLTYRKTNTGAYAVIDTRGRLVTTYAGPGCKRRAIQRTRKGR